MNPVVRLLVGLSMLGCALGAASSLVIENEALVQAQKMVDQRDYAGARTLLGKVDRAKLSADDVREMDRLSALVRRWEESNKPQGNAGVYGGSGSAQPQQPAQPVQSGTTSTGSSSTLTPTGSSAGTGRPSEVIELTPRGRSTTQPPVSPTPSPSPSPTPVPPVLGAAPSPVYSDSVSAGSSTMVPARGTVVDDMRMRDDLLWQKAVARMEELIQKAGQAIGESRFEEANEHAASAVQAVEGARQFAVPVSKYEAAHTVAMEAQRQVREDIDRINMENLATKREEIAQSIAANREAKERQRQEKIEQLFATAKQLNLERRHFEAADNMRQVLLIDPANAKAANLLETYGDSASLSEQRNINNENTRQTQDLLLETEEAKIPWHDDVLYPRNWPEISTRRDRLGLAARSDEDGELNSRLESVQEEVNFQDLPLDNVFDQLREHNKLNLAVDWDDLANHGIERDAVVSLKARGVSLRSVINQLLSQVGGDVSIGYASKDGLLRVASREKLDRDKFILVYDVRDLIVEIPRFAHRPPTDLEDNQTTRTSGDFFETSAFARSFPREDSAPVQSEAYKYPTNNPSSAGRRSSVLVSEILDILRQTVKPDSWRETGGDGALRELNGQLIVYNTSDAHRQVKDLLNQLRETRALMISVESRFLVVTSNFLEEIGVDLDFVLNQGTAGFDQAFNGQGQVITDPFTGAPVLMPRNFTQTGVFPAVPGVGNQFAQGQPPAQPFNQAGFVPAGGGVVPSLDQFTPIGISQNSRRLADPSSLNTGIAGSIPTGASYAPALSLAGSFLDNLQVDFLIRATQANRRSAIVQAPRLMLFNGQRAYVAAQRTRQFVSTVNAQVAQGAVGVQPVPQQIASGTTLDVEGTIDAVRKYVTLTVRTDLQQEPRFDNFEVQRASGNSPGIFIRLPDQETRVIRTTVSVPDGGTVLLGGLKQVGEIEVEAGVPILSKIPILKRAFTNTSTVKDTQTLLILLKAKILIQQEAEDEAFPTFSSAGL